MGNPPCETLSNGGPPVDLVPGTASYEHFLDAGRRCLDSLETDERHPDALRDLVLRFCPTYRQAVSPLCAFKPADANEMAVLIRLAKQTKCPFAIKSGDHGMAASNVQDGISVSLKTLNEITISTDKQTVAIGPGNTWSTVYSTLEKDGIGVAGGRYPSVGVGGLMCDCSREIGRCRQHLVNVFNG